MIKIRLENNSIETKKVIQVSMELELGVLKG